MVSISLLSAFQAKVFMHANFNGPESHQGTVLVLRVILWPILQDKYSAASAGLTAIWVPCLPLANLSFLRE